MSDYFNMDGYGGFIWPAYAVAAAVLIGLAVYTLWRSRVEKDALDKLEADLGTQRRKET